MEVEHERDITQIFLEAEEGCQVQPKTQDVGEDPPFTLMIMRVDAPESPRGMSQALLASAALGSTSS